MLVHVLLIKSTRAFLEIVLYQLIMVAVTLPEYYIQIVDKNHLEIKLNQLFPVYSVEIVLYHKYFY